MKIKFEWEQVRGSTWRAKVLGGWLIKTRLGDESISMIFISDPNHEWDVELYV